MTESLAGGRPWLTGAAEDGISARRPVRVPPGRRAAGPPGRR
ncbi:hypothetical protein [Streptomyces mirabilis]